MRIIFLALVIGFFASGCRPRKPALPPPPHSGAIPARDTLVEGTVIKRQGTWLHNEGGALYAFTVSPASKRVAWSSYTSRSGPGPERDDSSGAIDLPSPTSPWFIYVESPQRLWFCDGGSKLSYMIWTSSGANGDAAILDGSLKEGSEPVPDEVIPLLPADLQKLFPKSSAKPRPSI